MQRAHSHPPSLRLTLGRAEKSRLLSRSATAFGWAHVVARSVFSRRGARVKRSATGACECGAYFRRARSSNDEARAVGAMQLPNASGNLSCSLLAAVRVSECGCARRVHQDASGPAHVCGLLLAPSGRQLSAKHGLHQHSHNQVLQHPLTESRTLPPSCACQARSIVDCAVLRANTAHRRRTPITYQLHAPFPRNTIKSIVNGKYA